LTWKKVPQNKDKTMRMKVHIIRADFC
jgi:hypothetical protein